jgi:hypothetical protein
LFARDPSAVPFENPARNDAAKLCVSVRNYAVLFDSVPLFRIRNECDVDFSVKTLDEFEFTA